jgi:drug/metabolite transporter (DMT)-like permease
VRTDRTALLCLIATGAMLGVTTILAKLASREGLAPLPFLLWASVGAGVALAAVAALRGQRLRPTRRMGEYHLVAGLVGVAAPNLILFAAIPKVGAGFAAVCIAFPPLYTYVGALLLGMERFDAGRLGGVVLALSGAATLALFKLSAPDAQVGWVLATLAVPVILAVGNLYRTLRWPPGATADQLAPGMMVATALLLAVFGLVTAAPMLPAPERPAHLALIGVQAVVFALQYLMFFVLQRRGGPVLLSLIGSVAALVGVPLSVLVLGEGWPRGLAVATVLIVVGVSLVARRPAPA